MPEPYKSNNVSKYARLCQILYGPDNDKKVMETTLNYDFFWTSDILITDISSVIYEYFITGKPIIYCFSNIDIDFVYESKRILEVCYNVYTKNDLLNYIEMLKNGIDPLKNKRIELIEELYSTDILLSSKNIAQNLLEN